MQEIILLADYKNRFGSKYNASTYRGGMDLNLIFSAFEKRGYKIIVVPFSKVNFRKESWKDKLVLYTSQEDVGYFYKNYIEDIVLGLELAGAKIIPSFNYLRANNNKVFMEILRDLSSNSEIKNLQAKHYGTYEEVMKDSENLKYPVVIKSAEGAMSKNVALAQNKQELAIKVKKLSSTRSLKNDLWDYFRSKKHKGYKRESKYRKKLIVQNLVPELTKDYKVLVFGNKTYVSERLVRKNDFRASGSGKIQFGSNVDLPNGMLEYINNIREVLNVPMVSLDVAFHNNDFYLIEFQAIYFGTSIQWKSDCFYEFVDGDFVKKENNKTLEELYVNAIVNYVESI